jgi:hypothetical protein
MTSRKTTWLSFIALADDTLPDAEALVSAVARQDCSDSQLRITGQTDALITFSWGDATVLLARVGQPIPAAQLVGPCEIAWYWPQAATAVAQHQAHLLITLIDEGHDPVEKGLRLTVLTSAVADSVAALGIVWGPAGLIHEPAAFAEQTGQMTRENLPLFLWIDFRITVVDEQLYQLCTTGLEAFERLELEVAHCRTDPQQLLDDLYNVAHYTIDQSTPLKDADTIGPSEDRQLTARHETSLLNDHRRVIRLEYG